MWFFLKVDAVVYLVDASDRDRFPVSRRELEYQLHYYIHVQWLTTGNIKWIETWGRGHSRCLCVVLWCKRGLLMRLNGCFIIQSRKSFKNFGLKIVLCVIRRESCSFFCLKIVYILLFLFRFIGRDWANFLELFLIMHMRMIFIVFL